MEMKPNFRRSSPLLYGLQKLYDITPIDGLYGPKTKAAVDKLLDYPALYEFDIANIELEYRVLEIIGLFEVGNCRNPWYRKTVVKSEGWENYGVMQLNKLGSLTLLKNFAKFTDPDDFFNSPECIEAQLNYFHCYVEKRVVEFGFTGGCDFLLKCDALVQGGTLYPSRAPRSYEDWQLGDTLKREVELLYEKFPVKEAFIRACKLHPLMFAELHPRSGHPLYLGELGPESCTA
jgi:hypothetical protein